MLENKQLAVIVARYVFPSMKSFSTSWVARVGSLEAYLSETAAAAQVLVVDNGSPCYAIKVSGGMVEAINGDETCCLKVNDLTGVPVAAAKIREFFEVRHVEILA